MFHLSFSQAKNQIKVKNVGLSTEFPFIFGVIYIVCRTQIYHFTFNVGYIQTLTDKKPFEARQDVNLLNF